MNEAALVSVIALLGWLVLISRSGALRHVGGKRKLAMAATWVAAFIVAALIFQSVA